MTDAASRLRRLLHLLPEVADGRPCGLGALAERAGVDPKTVMGDLRALAERYDVPGGFVEGVGVYVEADEVSVTTDHFRRPMRLVEPELRALELGLAVLARERPPEERAAIERARKRLRDAVARLPESDLDMAWLACAGGGGADQATLATLRQAVRDRCLVRIEYQKAHEEEGSWREVAPVGLVFGSGAWYLVAASGEGSGRPATRAARTGSAANRQGGGVHPGVSLRGGKAAEAIRPPDPQFRFFRVDRVLAVEPTDQSFELPEGCTLDAVMASPPGFTFPESEPLVVRFAPSAARWIAEREGRELEADGSLTVEYPLGDVEWAVRFVLQYGGAAEVVGPAEVRERVGRVVGGLVAK